MEKDHILKEIDRTAQENHGNPLGVIRFEKETGISEGDWKGKYWTRWSEALIEAGYRPNPFTPAHDEEWLINQLTLCIRELKHFPTGAELMLKRFRDKEFPSHITFRKRFGNKSKLVQTVINFCINKKELSDILEICRSTQVSHDSENLEISVKDSNVQYGFVYLTKSGRFYKIGKSDLVEKRNYEISLKLAEEPKLIHKIKTDDPFGVEAYWHKRFEVKRKRGEWFELDSKDVQAFKRWKRIF
jgi:hypothetical protein